MHRRDVLVAWAFVIGLWFSIIFVALATWNLAPNGTARTILLIAGGVVLLFNTAAIIAMLRHYREDRDFMYGLDIKFHDCPLRNAWREEGLPDEEIATLCRIAARIDNGTFEAAGFEFSADTWQPGEEGCCYLHIRPGRK